jgi:transposase
MKTATEVEYAAFVGIDWADRKHDVCLQPADSSTRELTVLAHRPEAIAPWAQGLRTRFAGRPVVVCVELNQGPLVYALHQDDFLVRSPVNPATLTKYRAAFCPSHATDDATDAELALEVLLAHRDKLNALHPQSAPMRTWPRLVEQLRAVLQAVARFDRAIAQLAVTRPDYALFSTLPGAGPVLAPRLLAAFGDQRERYPHAAAVQQYVGIAPVTERSGNKCWVHWRLRCPTFLRQTFVAWAAQSIPHSS